MGVAIAQAARSKAGMNGIQAHERKGRALMAKSRWGQREVESAQQWLSLFVLGRAAFEARVLICFVHLGAGLEQDLGEQRRLRAMRFQPLSEVLPDQPGGIGVWTCVTV